MATALITGASRGMGLLTALRLAAEGYTVFAGARDPERLSLELRASDADMDLLRPVALDVTDDASVELAVAVVSRGATALDVVINNAGIPGSWAAPDELRLADFASVMDTNVLGAARVTQAFLPLLRRATSPRLVFVSSAMGSFASQTADPVFLDIAHVPYPASKAAVNMLAVQYAKALPGVRVTAVDPGLTATEFTQGSGHAPEEGAAPIIAAALDVTSPSGRFTNGAGLAPW